MRSTKSPRGTELVATEPVDTLIRVVRGQRVISDADLARVYGVPTKRLNEAVRRNAQRFPTDFLFQLTCQEALACLRSQFATSRGHDGFQTVDLSE